MYASRYTVVFYVFATIPPLPFARKRKISPFYITFQSISLGGAYVYCLWLERLFVFVRLPQHCAACGPLNKIENETVWHIRTQSVLHFTLYCESKGSLIKMNLRKMEFSSAICCSYERSGAGRRGERETKRKIRCSKAISIRLKWDRRRQTYSFVTS